MTSASPRPAWTRWRNSSALHPAPAPAARVLQRGRAGACAASLRRPRRAAAHGLWAVPGGAARARSGTGRAPAGLASGQCSSRWCWSAPRWRARACSTCTGSRCATRGRGSRPERPALPGQDVPGLGLAAEAQETALAHGGAARPGGAGVPPRGLPSGVSGRATLRFVDPARQGRLRGAGRPAFREPLAEATRAVAEGRVRLDGKPYAWEGAEEMVKLLQARPDDRPAIEAARAAARFTLSWSKSCSSCQRA